MSNDGTKAAAELIREIAAADPEGHNHALARGYGCDPDADLRRAQLALLLATEQTPPNIADILAAIATAAEQHDTGTPWRGGMDEAARIVAGFGEAES